MPHSLDIDAFLSAFASYPSAFTAIPIVFVHLVRPAATSPHQLGAGHILVARNVIWQSKSRFSNSLSVHQRRTSICFYKDHQHTYITVDKDPRAGYPMKPAYGRNR